MKKIINFVLFFALTISSTNLAFAIGETTNATSSGGANKTGTAGSQFLKIPIGARGTGMTAYSSLANDLSSVYWNPAGLAYQRGLAAEFSYLQWFAGYTHNYAAVSYGLGNDYTIAAHLISLSSGDIQVATTANPEGLSAKYQNSDIAAGLSFSGFLTEQFSFGISAKYITNTIYNVSASGIAFDIGTLYDTRFLGIKIGFSIHNLGTETSFSGQSLRDVKKLYSAMDANPMEVEYIANGYSYPLIFRAGLSSNVWKQDKHSITAAFDFTTFSDVPEEYALGAEYTYSDIVSLRAGYLFGQDQMGFSAGIGIKYDGPGFIGKFDYAISPTFDLGLVNRFTIGLSL
ncbi:MAG: PorV/PorQ family protein [Chloroherpetonaceae bacterium]|nr:PorV/PorQ family protein [bacterium]